MITKGPMVQSTPIGALYCIKEAEPHWYKVKLILIGSSTGVVKVHKQIKLLYTVELSNLSYGMVKNKLLVLSDDDGV